MSAFEPASTVLHAVLDGEGRLLSADARFLEWNARAGGAIGEPLGSAPLARLVRLAARLRILISRQIVVADQRGDLVLWARAEPRDGGVALAITGVEERAAWIPTDESAREFVAADAEWMWETDAALRLTFLPAADLARYGLDAAALLGAPLTRLFTLDAGDDGALPILNGIALRSAFGDQPARLRDGGRPLRLSAAPRLDRHGQFAGYIGGARDATEEPVRPAAETLSGGFTGRLDRALRGSLDRIIANADSINAQADGPLAPDYVGYAADIAQAGRHLLGLVGDLADLEAVERPDFTIVPEVIDLADLARRAAGLLAVRAGEGGVRIDAPKPDEELRAQGEFGRVLQILVNLLSNALRYSPRGAMVWIRLEQLGEMAAVTVADQGKGIAMEDQARIFGKFERVDPQEAGGSGLGLYIARRLARAMGGDLSVDSAPGQGARFVLTLPLAS
ncbi:sensor histidine kinase [Sphingomonas aracearum]|uniref:histidine kinase n=1 Tax=Sphingomonas aracearum TaxID=2283317 RepID=A0A369VSF4_9SPHN|nr:HAMP domain-containing sensor histidine kinase [Sphingomonas aracearum]RDE05326.1 sensor histidine kinase [Sphingomonas aracearum]